MSIQIVEIAQPSVIDTVAVAQPSTVAVVEIRQGPAGAGGGGSNSITSATTSDGTANLSISNVTTATAEVTGTLTANHIHGNLAGNVYAHVRAGETLTKGDPVYVSGSHGSGSTLIAIVSKADASNAAKMPAVGIMDANLANNATGHMVITGTITDVNTAGYAINAELYVAAGGGMTATPPTARAQPVARVERVNLNNGAIIVKVNGLSASDATPSTLVRRDASGAAEFVGLTVTGGTTFGDASLIQFDAVEYYYGAGAASAHRFALNNGAATGDALFTAVSPTTARDILDSGAIGDAIFRADNIAQLDAAMGITTLKKAADTSLTSNTFATVSDFTFAVVSGVTYRIWGELIMQSVVNTIGFKSELRFPVIDSLSSQAIGWIVLPSLALQGLGFVTSERSAWVTYSGAAAFRRMPFDLTLRFSAAGNVTIVAAQNTTDAANPSLVKERSFLKYQIIDC